MKTGGLWLVPLRLCALAIVASVLFGLSAASAGASLPTGCTQTGFNVSCTYTSVVSFTVPAGVTKVHVDAKGAAGTAGASGSQETIQAFCPGVAAAPGGSGGFGDVRGADFSVSSGDVFQFDPAVSPYAGGKGGSGAVDPTEATSPCAPGPDFGGNGGAGGGAAAVSLNGVLELVAAGGGGGGGGSNLSAGSGGQGGSGGQAGGDGLSSGSAAQGGSSGSQSSPAGGTGTTDSSTTFLGGGGGGGGGGLFGGGGGQAVNQSGGGGGGGGTSFVRSGLTGLTGGASGGGASVTVTYTLADQPPATTIALTPSAPNSNGWYNQDVAVTVGATDTDGTGVAETRCALDPATVPATFSDLPSTACPFLGAGTAVSSEGTHILYAASTDTAGTVESVQSVSFKIDKTAPVISVPANIIVVTNQPAGAVVSFSASATDNLDPNPTLGCSPASGSVFAVGITTVTCNATDAAGNPATASFSVTVRSPTQEVAILLSQVTTTGQSGMINTAQQIQTAIANGKTSSACGNLTTFLGQVQAQSGKTITTSQAATFTTEATALQKALGCK